MNELAALLSHRMVTYTKDYAENSSYLVRYMNKLDVILPPVVLPEISNEEKKNFGLTHNSENRRPVIGMAARFATEKGVEVLLKALPKVLKEFPATLVQFAGPYKNIIGEESYFRRLVPTIEAYKKSGNWEFLGVLDPEQMAAFYPNLDVLVLPSLNATEAFGLVQIEAMINGTPCIASNLPGVRQPVKMHKMGVVVEIGDSEDLASELIKILKNPASYKQDYQNIHEQYRPSMVAAEYERIFDSIAREQTHT